VSDISLISKTETEIVITDLPSWDWPKLQKFTAIEHLFIAEGVASRITDEHLKMLSRLNMPGLRDISFAYCDQVTDKGICALTNLPSITELQLMGVGITDEGLKTLVTGLPRLDGINVCQCRLLTCIGFLSMTNSPTLKAVGLSLDNLSQVQLQRLISGVTNVTWWTIQDPKGDLDLESLRRLKQQMNITIQIEDAGKSVRSL